MLAGGQEVRGAIEREQRRLERAYDDAPDYVQRVYRDFYRMHRRANATDHAYASHVVGLTRASRTLDIPKATSEVAAMNRAADKSKRLDDRTERLLDQAREASEEYVRDL